MRVIYLSNVLAFTNLSKRASWHFQVFTAYLSVDFGVLGLWWPSSVDASGRCLLQQINVLAMCIQFDGTSIELDISTLSSGFYVVQMENVDGLITERIRKN